MLVEPDPEALARINSSFEKMKILLFIPMSYTIITENLNSYSEVLQGM
jgi:hypothetical protein